MKRPFLTPFLLALLTLFVYALTAGGHLYSPDEEVLFRVTRSLALGQGFAVDPLDPANPTQSFATQAPPTPRADHKHYAQYGVGQSLLAVPFYWAGAALAHTAGEQTWQRLYGQPAVTPQDLGYAPTAAELAPRWACSWFNIAIGALLAFVIYSLVFEVIPNASAALIATLLYSFGTLAWPHSRPFFTESLAALCILFSWYALLRAVSGRIVAWCFVAGLAAGFAALTRLDSVFAYPALAVLLLTLIPKACRERSISIPTAWCAFAIPAALCGAIIVTLNTMHFGTPFSSGYKDGAFFQTPVLAGLYIFILSIGKGVFFFSPPLILSFWGWGHLLQRVRERFASPSLILALALAILIPLLMLSTWSNPAGGWCWGPRHVYLVQAMLILPVAAWLSEALASPRRIIIPVLLVIGIAVQLLGSSQDFIAFHKHFFRSPGSPRAFFIRYDENDRQYWDGHYQLLFHQNPNDPSRPVPLFPPVPIQDSIYHPQRSVWAGYPQMWRDGLRDNFWLHLMHSNSPQLTSASGNTP